MCCAIEKKDAGVSATPDRFELRRHNKRQLDWRNGDGDMGGTSLRGEPNAAGTGLAKKRTTARWILHQLESMMPSPHLNGAVSVLERKIS